MKEGKLYTTAGAARATAGAARAPGGKSNIVRNFYYGVWWQFSQYCASPRKFRVLEKNLGSSRWIQVTVFRSKMAPSVG